MDTNDKDMRETGLGDEVTIDIGKDADGLREGVEGFEAESVLDPDAPMLDATKAPAPEKPKPKKPDKPKEKTIFPPLICLVIALGAFMYFFLAAFPRVITSQAKLIAVNEAVTPTVRISVDPAVLYRTGISTQGEEEGANAKADSQMFLYEMKDGYALLVIKTNALRAFANGDTKTLSGIKMPPISEDLVDAVANVVAQFDEKSPEEAKAIAGKIPMVDMTVGTKNNAKAPAIVAAVLAGASLFWLLQRMTLRSTPAKRRSRSHK